MSMFERCAGVGDVVVGFVVAMVVDDVVGVVAMDGAFAALDAAAVAVYEA